MALPTGKVTFLFTDIEDSTRLWDNDPRAMESALGRHDAILQKTIEANDGQIVKATGDGFFAVFAVAVKAIAAAVDCQRRLSSEIWPEKTTIRVRMALHSGEAQVRAGDYFGADVNRAARLLSLAAGGQILLSAAAVELAGHQLPAEVALIDLGRHVLRGLYKPEHVFQLSSPGLASVFPPLKSPDVFPNNLPQQLTSFIGREQEVYELVNLLAPSEKDGRTPLRLVTLTGPGGTGKTRLSMQVAHELLPQFPDGTFFVGLAAAADPAQVPNAVASALGIAEQPDISLAALLQRYLRNKRMLLVLDNFEHLMQAAPMLVDLLEAAPHLTALVTSREALRIRGEREYAVHPLPIPGAQQKATVAELSNYESIALFTLRAQDISPDFRLTDQNAPQVAEICRHLDGLPLAIELAAARIRLFSPERILERLKDRFALLSSGPRDLPDHQRTLRATIDWSFNLLDGAEQRLFGRLAVFRGGRTVSAAEAVCGPGLQGEVLDGLDSLLTKNLLFQKEGPGGEPRLLMLETIHEYAGERLAAGGEEREMRERHLRYFRSLAEEMEPGYRLHGQIRLLQQTEVEWGNLQTAFQWALDNGHFDDAARLISALDYFLRFKEHVVEGNRWINRLLPEIESLSKDRQARLYLAATRLTFVKEDPVLTRELAERAFELAQESGDRRSMAFTMLALGVFDMLIVGDYVEAMKTCQEAQAIFRALDDKPGLAEAHNARGEIARVAGDAAAASREYQKSLELSQETGEVLRIQMIRSNLVYLAYDEGNYERAKELGLAALNGWLDIEVRQGIISALGALAGPFTRLGQPEKAAQLLGAAQALFAEMGAGEHPADLPERAKYMVETRKNLGDAEFLAAWKEGEVMKLEEAVDCALQE